MSKRRNIHLVSYKMFEDKIPPQYAIQNLNELTDDERTIIGTEVGQHQMWAIRFTSLRGLNC